MVPLPLCNSNKLPYLLLPRLRAVSAFAHSQTIAPGCRCRSVLGGDRLAAAAGAAAGRLEPGNTAAAAAENQSSAGGAPFLPLPPLPRRRLLGLQTPGS